MSDFVKEIWSHYYAHKRNFIWRSNIDPYCVCISEIMLQQTQTCRVEPIFQCFIERFPNFHALAQAPFAFVIRAWQGLGYNRRALYVHKIAQKVMNEYQGVLPKDPALLETFPGIGKNTAGSICAFAFNKPVVFIETNIRSVFIHFFFQSDTNVHDKELMPLIEKTIDKQNPREWYYALMDYGVMLKKKMPNPSRSSKHHAKQSTFEGSDRQIRGMILRLLTESLKLSIDMIFDQIPREQYRIEKALSELERDGLIKVHEDIVQIS